MFVPFSRKCAEHEYVFIQWVAFMREPLFTWNQETIFTRSNNIFLLSLPLSREYFQHLIFCHGWREFLRLNVLFCFHFGFFLSNFLVSIHTFCIHLRCDTTNKTNTRERLREKKEFSVEIHFCPFLVLLWVWLCHSLTHSYTLINNLLYHKHRSFSTLKRCAHGNAYTHTHERTLIHSSTPNFELCYLTWWTVLYRLCALSLWIIMKGNEWVIANMRNSEPLNYTAWLKTSFFHHILCVVS